MLPAFRWIGCSVVLALVAFLAAGCRTAAPRGAESTLHDAAPAADQLDRGMREVSSLAANAKMALEDETAMYSACWKNPAGKDLTEIQKLVYCYLPLDFRLCNTIALTQIRGETAEDKALKVEVFGACQVSSGLASQMGSADIEATYVALFLEKGEGVADDVKADLLKAYRPTLSDASFYELFKHMVGFFVDERGGGDTGKAEVELTKILAPALSKPEIPAAIAKQMVDAYRGGQELADIIKDLI